jgi:hypothetical protein
MHIETLPEISNIHAKKLLQLLSEFEYDDSVTEPISEVLKAMKQRVEYEGRQLMLLDTEQNQLADAYHRYVELREITRTKARLPDRLHAILGKSKNLQHLKLWEVLELYLSFVPEAQVADILGFFDWVGYKSTRQAIESTIKTHKSQFVVRKEGWDRFISLARKESDAAATKRERK